jgi:hypothetical protein
LSIQNQEESFKYCNGSGCGALVFRKATVSSILKEYLNPKCGSITFCLGIFFLLSSFGYYDLKRNTSFLLITRCATSLAYAAGGEMAHSQYRGYDLLCASPTN